MKYAYVGIIPIGDTCTSTCWLNQPLWHLLPCTCTCICLRISLVDVVAPVGFVTFSLNQNLAPVVHCIMFFHELLCIKPIEAVVVDVQCMHWTGLGCQRVWRVSMEHRPHPRPRLRTRQPRRTHPRRLRKSQSLSVALKQVCFAASKHAHIHLLYLYMQLLARALEWMTSCTCSLTGLGSVLPLGIVSSWWRHDTAGGWLHPRSRPGRFRQRHGVSEHLRLPLRSHVAPRHNVMPRAIQWLEII